MTPEQVIKDIKNKVYSPVYFLMGEEPYYIDLISDYVEDHVLDESEKEFNQTVLYGRDTDVQSIVDIAKRFPMMANNQVVIVKEAQHIRNLSDLQPYVESPLNSTLLVLCYKYKKLDKRKEFAKVLGKKGILFESKKLYDNKIPAWVKSYMKSKGYEIGPKATALVAESLGTDLSKISNELNKLTLNVPKGEEINLKHIEQNIGISKDYNIFELQNAIGNKNVLKANKIAIYFGSNQKNHPLVVTIGTLYTFFSKILVYHYSDDKSKNGLAAKLKVNPYFVNDYQIAARNFSIARTVNAISHLREFDLKSKGVNNASTDQGELLKELIFKILH